jgi:hypothetical protein
MQTRKISNLLFGIIGTTALISGCVVSTVNPNATSTALSATTTTTTTTTSTQASIAAGLYFTVTSAWDSTPTALVDQVACSIPLNAVPGSTMTCNLTMPEGQLYFSNLALTIGSADLNLCKEVIYYPYGFLASAVDTYTQSKFGAVQAQQTCLTAPSTACYDGAAVTQFPTYPLLTNVAMETASAYETTYTVPSPFSLMELTNTSSANFITNKAANDTAVNTAGTTLQTYVAGSMQGYRAECRDEYYELIYSIDFVLKSIPSTGGGVISFPGWH